MNSDLPMVIVKSKLLIKRHWWGVQLPALFMRYGACLLRKAPYVRRKYGTVKNSQAGGFEMCLKKDICGTLIDKIDI